MIYGKVRTRLEQGSGLSIRRAGSGAGLVRGGAHRDLSEPGKVFGTYVRENLTLNRVDRDDHTGTGSAAQEDSGKAPQRA